MSSSSQDGQVTGRHCKFCLNLHVEHVCFFMKTASLHARFGLQVSEIQSLSQARHKCHTATHSNKFSHLGTTNTRTPIASEPTVFCHSCLKLTWKVNPLGRFRVSTMYEFFASLFQLGIKAKFVNDLCEFPYLLNRTCQNVSKMGVKLIQNDFE